MDPFLMQLVIVPLIVIGLGVLVAVLVKKAWLSPLLTLGLNILYEYWYMNHYYPDSNMSFTSWNVIFPVFSWLISWVLINILYSKTNG